MAINRSLTFFQKLATTIDSGGAVDIRLMESSNTASAGTQSVAATHTQDSVNRTFDPGNTGVTTAQAPVDTPTLGWGLRLAEDMTPVDDTNCNAILPAGSATVSMWVTMTKVASGVDVGGTQSPDWLAALFRYNPTTNTGVLIASATVGGTTWNTAVVGNDENVFKKVDIALSWASLIEFLPGEILVLALGVNTGTLTNPTTGTTTYTFTFQNDDAGSNSKIVFATAGISQKCRYTYSSGLDLNAAFAETTKFKPTFVAALDLAAAYSRKLLLKRSAVGTLDLNGSYSRILRLKPTYTATLDLNAVRGAWLIRLRNSGLVAALDLNAAKVFLHRRAFAAGLDLNAAYSRMLTGFRSFSAVIDLNAAYSRIVRVRRTFTGTLDLAAELFVKISQTILNRMAAGGVTIVKKIQYLFDD